MSTVIRLVCPDCASEAVERCDVPRVRPRVYPVTDQSLFRCMSCRVVEKRWRFKQFLEVFP